MKRKNMISPMDCLFLSWFLVMVALMLGQNANGAPVDAEVTHFPGFDAPLPSKHYVGYITMGDKNGGPGCSLFCGLLELIGPLYIDHEQYHTGQAMPKQNPFSWTKVSNILFVDNSAGTGYSYFDNIEDYTTNDTVTVSDLYEFILKWFSEYSEFLPNPLYLAGCSYSGIMVPAVSQLIVNGIEAGSEPKLNFKDYSIANGAIDRDLENNSRIPFAHQMGLISERQYRDLATTCNGKYWKNDDPNCLRNLETFQRNVAGVYIEHIIYQPCCFKMEISMEANEYDSVGIYPSLPGKNGYSIHCQVRISCSSQVDLNHDMIPKRLLDPETSRRNLHAKSPSPIIPGQLYSPADLYRSNWGVDKVHKVYQLYHLNLTKKGYRAFIYSGDHDLLVPYTATLEAIKALNYSVIEDWHPWFVGNQLAGYMVRYAHNLLFATFKGAGHTPMEYMQCEALVAYQRWIEGANFL